MVGAPGRMIDSFLSIPDAEPLPLYRMVLKRACVCVSGHEWRQMTSIACSCASPPLGLSRLFVYAAPGALEWPLPVFPPSRWFA